MAIKQLSIKFAFGLVLTALLGPFALAQQAPKQEKLLNGLKVLMFPSPSADRAEVRLRIHSGSAFDPQGREGVMKMLAETIFPSDAARSYFTEDLGGDLKIISNYDYIEIAASSRPEQLFAMLETLSNSVSDPTIDKETTDMVRASVLKNLEGAMKDASYVADEAIAERLLGTFPYGRPENGTPESLGQVDFADIRLAYERFFGADNATLAISGKFEPTGTYRAVRRYFGSWLKSDKRVPPTFRQPDAPPVAYKMVPSPENGRSEIRFAVRGFARSDADLPAGAVLAKIYQDRLRAKSPADRRDAVFVTHRANILPGTLVFAVKDIRWDSVPVSGGKFEASDMVKQVMSEKVTDVEFAAARAAVQSAYNATDNVTLWLDVDTYRLASIKSERAAFANVSIADVHRVAEKLKAAPMATVLAVTPVAAEQK
jgi:zinc protease